MDLIFSQSALILVGKTSGKHALERPRRKWEDKIPMGSFERYSEDAA
jgi:hypothetical protein